MAYYLGVDLGTTYTAAAVWREHKVEIANLGNRAPVVPSLLLLRDDEELLAGEAADRRGASEPGRLAREFKRRLGDPAPIIIGGTPYSATSLMGRLMRWVVDKVAEAEGGPSSGIALSHPANWGPYKTDLLTQAIQIADLDGVTTLTEPEAAAIHYATQSRVSDGSVIGVYDLGGGTFDSAVLRKVGQSFEILGEPQGIERLGGVDFDEAVYQHVLRSVGDQVAALDPDDPTARAAMARLRSECIEAKEALSADTDAAIPVILPGFQGEVRITRGEFEHLIRPALNDSITSVARALRSANIEPEDLTTVLLVGGSSRIPLVGQMVGAALGRPVAVDAHPKHGIALGAATVAAQRAGAVAQTTLVGAAPEPMTPPPVAPVVSDTPAPVAPQPSAPVARVGSDAPDAAATDGPPSATGPPSERVLPSPEPAPKPPDKEARKVPVGILAGATAAVVILLIGAFVLFGGGDDKPKVAAQEPSSTTTTGGSTTSSTSTTLPAPIGPSVEITDAAVENGRFRVRYSVSNFVPLIDGGPDSLHLHVFLDTTDRQNAGNNGSPPGVWEITDDPTTHLMVVGPAQAAGAKQMCAVVATVGHNVFDSSSFTPLQQAEVVPAGNCVDLPT